MVDRASPNARLLTDTTADGHTPRSRIGGALGASMFSHVVGALVVLFVVGRVPAGMSTANPTPHDTPSIVWIATPSAGDARGGGGSGNHKPDPPRRMELPGADRLSLPAALSSRLVTDPPKTVTQPVPQIEMPAIAAAAGIDTAVGVVSALPVVNSDSQGPGAGGAAGTGKGTGNGPGSGPGLGDGRDGGTGGDVYRDGSGVVSPRLIREVRPLYTSDAMRAKVQGVVGIEAVVLADGSVGKAQVVRSLDTAFGLDEEALRTVRQWRFAPGRRSGQPVAVMVLIEMAFTLR